MANKAQSGVERVLIRPESLSGAEVEIFLGPPDGPEPPYPVVLFVHGHQFPERLGARVAWELSEAQRARGLKTFFDRVQALGFLAAAVSQPGYGASDGPSDYCGPRTQSAIRVALRYLRGLPNIDPKRVLLYGVSRGAIASAMVATAEPDLRGVVLIGGLYDFAAVYPTGIAGLDANIEQEAGTTQEAFAARSALPLAHRIRARVMILHGRLDEVGGAAQATALAEALQQSGNPPELHLFDRGHKLPVPQVWQAVAPFLRSVLQ